MSISLLCHSSRARITGPAIFPHAKERAAHRQSESELSARSIKITRYRKSSTKTRLFTASMLL